LIDTGLTLLNSVRNRLPDDVDDIKGSVRNTYNTASGRVGRAADALRGEEASQMLGKAVALAIGVGIGVGIGLLISDRLNKDQRKAAGWALLGVGVMTTIPILAGILGKGPFAERRVGLVA